MGSPRGWRSWGIRRCRRRTSFGCWPGWAGGWPPGGWRRRGRAPAGGGAWVGAGGVGGGGLEGGRVEAFLADCRSSGYTGWLSGRGLAPLLGYLRGLGIVPGPACDPPATAAELLLERYRGYLAGER